MSPNDTRELPQALREADEVVVPAGRQVFSQGQPAAHYLFVTEGSVRVFARSSEGREVVLYRVRPGEMCTLTTSCVLGRRPYPAEAVTETDVRARVLSPDVFDRELNESPQFRQFVFSNFSARLADIMQRMEQLVLESVRSRLARCLVRRSNAQGVTTVTHEQLALEIGSAREVVSRHLKALEQDGLIEMHRGEVVLLQPERLQAL